MKLETIKIQMLTYLNNIGNNGLLVINIIDFTILVHCILVCIHQCHYSLM